MENSYWEEVLKLLTDMLALANPWLLKWLLNFVDNPNTEEDRQPVWHGLFIVVLMFVTNSILSFTHLSTVLLRESSEWELESQLPFKPVFIAKPFQLVIM